MDWHFHLPRVVQNGQESEVNALALGQVHRRGPHICDRGGGAVTSGDTYAKSFEPIRSRYRPAECVRGGFVATDGASQGPMTIWLVQRYLLGVGKGLADLTVGRASSEIGGAGSIGVHNIGWWAEITTILLIIQYGVSPWLTWVRSWKETPSGYFQICERLCCN